MTQSNTPQFQATIPTQSASRYLQQLCKHWGHKFEVSFTPEQGTIALPFGPVALQATPDLLTVTLSPTPEADPAKMQQVVADHLNRFAHREGELTFHWQAL